MIKKVISCPKCGGKMRIPVGKHIRFTCPECKEKLEFNDGVNNKGTHTNEYVEFSTIPIVDKLPNSFSEIIPFLYIIFVIGNILSIRYMDSTKVEQILNIVNLSISLVFFIALYQGMSKLYKPMSSSISAIIFGCAVMIFFDVIHFGKVDMGKNATVLYGAIALLTIVIEIVFSARLMTNYRGRLFRLGRATILSCLFFIVLLFVGAILRIDNSISEKVFEKLFYISATLLGIWCFYIMKKVLSK